jgi:NAD(P)-dependent dehydrogenase (short-subunit alcohol dehydrogenase family)
MDQLKGKVALIAGAGGSIGSAIAGLFAQHGASLSVVDIDLSTVRVLAEEVDSPATPAIAIACDVTSPESTLAAVEATVERFGRLDTLVACTAAEIPRTRVVDLDPDAWRHMIDVTLTGSFLLCRAAIPPMIASGGGAVILVASQLGRVGSPGQAAYCASKGGVIQLARTLALEHGRDGLRINTLSPGAIASNRLRRRYGSDEAAEAALASRHAIGRLGHPREIAAAALFLASDNCPFMTGSDLVVDGGYTAA